MSTAVGPVRRSGRPRRRLWAVAKVLLLAVAGYLGGVGATNLFPAHAATDYYTAAISLGVVPDSTVRLPTVLGDVSLDFDGPLPAPGLIVRAQLRENVTDAFADGTPSVAEFRPDRAALDAASRAALLGLAWRFVAGFLVTVGVIEVARGAWRRPLRSSATVAAVTVIAVALPSVAGGTTYRAGNIRSLRTTSLLTLARNDLGLLDALEQRSAESSRYITSVLALSDAIQLRFEPQAAARGTALRVLFVSDIHGFNEYSLLQDLVRTQHIDAVVDSGDLINFGSVAEAEAAGIFTSISQLGVPYLFVKGNHDGSSAGDHALLDRLGRIRNVVVLQPGAGDYRKVTLAGVSFGGFNDPRFYGDGDPKDRTTQPRARRSFLTTYAADDESLPDVVISHEPQAVENELPTTSLLVAGHTHTPALDGNRMTVGTFTGGGLFGARLAGEADTGTEIETQSYSFDIATFDTGCSLASLSRYTFSGILRGDPQLQSRTTINGRQIVPAAKDRSCAGPKEPAITTVRAG